MNSDFKPSVIPDLLGPSLVIGVPFIDKEHLDLVSQLNKLISKPEANPGSEAFSDILIQLGNEIDSHFKHEETFFKSCGMPLDEVEAHLEAHFDILEQYAELTFEMMKGEKLSRIDVLSRIKNWVVEHVMKFDLKMRAFVTA